MRQRIEVESQQISYRELGSGSDVFILVHGFGNSSRMWLPFVLPHLNKGKFFLVDLPGFGLSRDAANFGANPLDAYAQVLGRLIERVGDKGVKLIGFSLGGYACLKLLASGRAKSVRAYLHIDHPANGFEIDKGVLDKFAEISRLAATIESADVLPTGTLPHALRGPYVDVLASMGDICLANPIAKTAYTFGLHAFPLGNLLLNSLSWDWSLAIFREYAFGLDDIGLRLPDISVPVTLAAGKQSRICSKESLSRLASLIPNNEVHCFRGGHDFMLSDFRKFTLLMSQFLRR